MCSVGLPGSVAVRDAESIGETHEHHQSDQPGDSTVLLEGAGVIDGASPGSSTKRAARCRSISAEVRPRPPSVMSSHASSSPVRSSK